MRNFLRRSSIKYRAKHVLLNQATKFVWTIPFQFQYSQQIRIKEFFLNPYSTQVNKKISGFYQSVTLMKEVESFLKLMQDVDSLDEEGGRYPDMEFYVFILFEKLLTFQESKQTDNQQLKKAYEAFYQLMFKNLKIFRKESLIMMLSLLVKEREASKRLFRLFEFIMVRTSFINVLHSGEIAQLVNDCDGLFNIVEPHSFVEIFDKIEKRICETKNEMSFHHSDFVSILFIFSSHNYGSEMFFNAFYEYFPKIYDLMTTEELISCVWSFVNSGYFKSRRRNPIISEKIQSMIETHLNQVNEYYLNLYYYALQRQL